LIASSYQAFAAGIDLYMPHNLAFAVENLQFKEQVPFKK
jgi:hypothetical protein